MAIVAELLLRLQQDKANGGKNLKIAFTTSGTDLTAPMDPRFGRATSFLIFNTETNEFVVIDNSHLAAAQGAGIKAAEAVVKAGAAVLVSGECGPKAFSALKKAGVRIYSVKAISVSEALDAYRAGKLQEAVAG
jgi:predicted Fe-Mo cluster-binding NifX family protein